MVGEYESVYFKFFWFFFFFFFFRGGGGGTSLSEGVDMPYQTASSVQSDLDIHRLLKGKSATLCSLRVTLTDFCVLI